jgi:tetratricopeptide (TPR) repeat protein
MNKGLVLVVILMSLFAADDRGKGREGNKRYHEKKYEEAARLFREGIGELKESTKAEIRTGLYNNLGAAMNRLESFEEASAAFAAAIEAAASDRDLARASYNAGNTAFQAQDPQRALDFYRNALLAEPDNESARFNYEFVRRMLESQKQQSDSESNQQQQQDQNQEQQEQQQDQEQQQEEQEQEQEQQEQQQGDQQQEQEQQEQEQEQEQEEQPDPSEEMTQEQAEQILQALQNDEEELMRQVWRMRGKPRSVDKDW